MNHEKLYMLILILANMTIKNLIDIIYTEVNFINIENNEADRQFEFSK